MSAMPTNGRNMAPVSGSGTGSVTDEVAVSVPTNSPSESNLKPKKKGAVRSVGIDDASKGSNSIAIVPGSKQVSEPG